MDVIRGRITRGLGQGASVGRLGFWPVRFILKVVEVRVGGWGVGGGGGGGGWEGR